VPAVNKIDLEIAKSALRRAGEQALRAAVDDVLNVARQRTPDDPVTGGSDLRNSYITLVLEHEDRVTATITNTAPYAVYQHEAHWKHTNGERKFLESAAKEAPLIDEAKRAMRRELQTKRVGEYRGRRR
jgi:hypothetical protein